MVLGFWGKVRNKFRFVQSAFCLKMRHGNFSCINQTIDKMILPPAPPCSSRVCAWAISFNGNTRLYRGLMLFSLIRRKMPLIASGVG